MKIRRHVHVWGILFNIGMYVTDLMFLTFYEFITSDVFNQVCDIISMDGDVFDNAKEVGAKAFDCVINVVRRGSVCVLSPS